MPKDRRHAPGNGDRRIVQRVHWRDVAASSDAGTEPSPDIWAAGLLRWWESSSGPASSEAQRFFRQIVELGRPYFSMAQQFTGAGEGQQSEDALERWLTELRQEYSSFAERVSAQADRSVHELLGFWQASLDGWRRAGVGPGENAIPGARGLFDPFATPAVGYTREWQEQYQRLGEAARTYLERLRDYNDGFVGVAVRSIDKLRAKLTDGAGRVTEVRGLYDVWVEACEAAYAEYFMSPEYAAVYGRLVNALAHLRRQISAIVDDALKAANLPTRKDLDTLTRRVHDTRRELALLRSAIAHAQQSERGPQPPTRPRAKPKKH